jgi:hypothetical protein
MKIEKLQQIVDETFDLVYDLCAAEGKTREEILSIHVAFATGFGFAIGRTYACCPEAEAQANITFMLEQVFKAAMASYHNAQADVAAFNLDQIVKSAGKGRGDGH